MQQPDQPGIVASDLEGTLTTGETWRGVGRYLTEEMDGRYRRAYAWFFRLRFVPAVLARLGWIEGQAFRNGWIRDLARFFSGFTAQQLQDMAEWVVERELWPKRREAVLAELARYREAGHRLVLASGTYQPVLEAFARRIGAEAIGTPVEVLDGRATGRLLGAVNTGSAKAQRLQEYARSLGAAIRAAFGDTEADVPMLQLSAEGVAVHPDRELAREAQAHGWRTLRA